LESRSLIVRVFLPFVAAYYLSYLFRSINALIAGRLASELGLGAGDLGLLTSVYFLTFAAAQIPIAVLLDRYGPRRIQSALLVAAAVGAALFAASDSFPMLLAGRALIGLGVAAALNAGFKALALWFPKDRLTLLNGLMVMLGALGAVTATAPAEWLLAWIGWRGIFELFAAVTAGCAVMIYLVVPEAAPAEPAPIHVSGAWRRSRRPVSERPGRSRDCGRHSGSQTSKVLIGRRWCSICSPWPSHSAWARFCWAWRPTGCAGLVSDRKLSWDLSQRSSLRFSSH
jgi:MFS family permease